MLEGLQVTGFDSTCCWFIGSSCTSNKWLCHAYNGLQFVVLLGEKVHLGF